MSWTEEEEMEVKAVTQELFDRAIRGIRKQGKQASENVDGMVRCRYRTSDGLRCAVGQLVDDDKYDPVMEKGNVYYGPVTSAVRRSNPRFEKINRASMIDAVLDVLMGLQQAHDRKFPESFLVTFEESVAQIAARNGLVVPSREG